MLDRSLPPPFVKPVSFHLPNVSRALLPNGVPLLHLNIINQDLVKIEVVFNAGKWFEEKPEAAHFTVQMLDKGTPSLTASQIAELFDQYGAHLELSSSFDFASVSLYVLSKYLPKVYPVFLELVTAPSFNELEFTLLKSQFIQALKIKNEKTSYLASKLIRKKIFGPDYPYGQPAEEGDIDKLQVADLALFFKKRMRPSHVFVLGKISDKDLKTIEETIGTIDTTTSPAPCFSISEGSSTKSYIKKKGSVQTSIRLGKQTLSRDHPDYPGLLILNYYLGGYFGSRLMKNLREEKGLTYGISATINSFKNNSVLLIGTDVNKENRALAISEIIREVSHLQVSINSGDMELAKRHFIGGLQVEMASPFSILEKVKNMELHRLPNTYYQDLIHKVDGIANHDLLELAGTYFKKGSLFEVSVG